MISGGRCDGCAISAPESASGAATPRACPGEDWYASRDWRTRIMISVGQKHWHSAPSEPTGDIATIDSDIDAVDLPECA